MIKTGEFDTMFSHECGIPKIDTIRNSLKPVSLVNPSKITDEAKELYEKLKTLY